MVAVVTTVAAEKFFFFKFNNFSVLLCKRQRGGATSLVAEKFQIFFNQIFQYWVGFRKTARLTIFKIFVKKGNYYT